MSPAAVVVLTPEQLRALIVDAVREALEGRAQEEPLEWLDTAAAAELLGVCTRTVTNLARTGELPGRRIGKLWRFRRADVEAFLARG